MRNTVTEKEAKELFCPHMQTTCLGIKCMFFNEIKTQLINRGVGGWERVSTENDRLRKYHCEL